MREDRDPRLAIVGVVVIGRNEGERLRACLASIPAGVGCAVYVDSGSTDGSAELAEAAGIVVVRLASSTPFTAARARNAGLRKLADTRPDLEFVQFVDADSALLPGWLEAGHDTLKADPGVVAVFGSCREVLPERSVFNRLCDLEWNRSPPGETRAFGGNVLARVAGMQQAGGYDATVIAAEDDELSVRLRALGWRIQRLGKDMTTHDAAMTNVTQWWRRALRTGYAYAQVFSLHGRPPERYFLTELCRAVVWGAALPALVVATWAPTSGLSLGLLAIYPLRVARIAWRCRGQGWSRRDAFAWAVNSVGSSFPQMAGVLRHTLDRMSHRTPTLIEHKGAR